MAGRQSARVAAGVTGRAPPAARLDQAAQKLRQLRKRPDQTKGDGMGDVVNLGRLWTVEDVSTYLGVPVKTLYKWRYQG